MKKSPYGFDWSSVPWPIHYLPSFTDFLERVRQCLSPGGDLSSVEHPISLLPVPQENWYYGGQHPPPLPCGPVFRGGTVLRVVEPLSRRRGCWASRECGDELRRPP